MALVGALQASRRFVAHASWRPSLSAGWLVATGVVLHLVLAASTALSPDEAHYALYGEHPDWSYFDHPPLVGWLQAPFVAASGHDLPMRVVPMLAWLVAVRLMMALCRRLPMAADGDRPDAARVDGWVALMMLASPMLNLLGVALVPDTLLMALVPAVMSVTWSLRSPAIASGQARWLLLALLLGLCLLSKYTGLFVVLGALLSLSRFHGASLLRRRGAWTCALVVVALASPVLAWNVQNHWASVAYQFAHSIGNQDWSWRSVLRAVLLQLALYGLLLPIAAARAWRARARFGAAGPRSDAGDARALVLAFAVPLLVVFAAMAGRGCSLPHWTACGWVALVPLAVAGVLRMGPRGVGALVLWQAALLVAILGVVLTGGPGTEAGAAATSAAGVRTVGKHPNPVADLVGWQAAAEHGAGLVGQHRARGLAVMNWSLASRLAWYARPMPVFVVPDHDDQFRLWFGALRAGDSAVVVDWSSMPLAVPMGPAGFRTCRPLDQLPTLFDGRQLAHFSYLLCEHWRDADPRH